MRRRHEAEPPPSPAPAVWQMAPATSEEVGPDIAHQLAGDRPARPADRVGPAGR